MAEVTAGREVNLAEMEACAASQATDSPLPVPQQWNWSARH